MSRSLQRDLAMVAPKRERVWALQLAPELDQALGRVLARAQIITKGLAQRLQVESSIIRILLWVWERTSGTQLDHSDKCKMFLSSCRLWAPLETRVDLIINGIGWGVEGERLTFDGCNRDQFLTSDDLNKIVEFVEYLRQDRKKSEFIARNADVGINRLYVHFNQRVDWDYELCGLREQRMLCSRSKVMKDGMV